MARRHDVAINGKSAAERRAVRQELSAPLVAKLHTWLTGQRSMLSRDHDLSKAWLYLLRRWNALTCFLDDWPGLHLEQRRQAGAPLRR